MLSDGGVYDNLGLETAWKNHRAVLVSDGGGRMGAVARVPGGWVRQSYRVNQVIDNQVRSLRKREAVAGFARGERGGTYWGIRSDVDAITARCPPACCRRRSTRPRSSRRSTRRCASSTAACQERLINWGYAACDVGMRRWVEPGATAPAAFPTPRRASA